MDNDITIYILTHTIIHRMIIVNDIWYIVCIVQHDLLTFCLIQMINTHYTHPSSSTYNVLTQHQTHIHILVINILLIRVDCVPCIWLVISYTSQHNQYIHITIAYIIQLLYQMNTTWLLWLWPCIYASLLICIHIYYVCSYAQLLL